MKDFINAELKNIASNFIKLQDLSPKIEQVASICIETLKKGNKIMFCGNGGSAADSQHLAAELVGRYKLNRPAIHAISLTVNTSILTAIGNDFGYDSVFERQLEAIGQNGDLLIGLSTSGNSKNILAAFLLAKKKKITTVAMTGLSGGEMIKLADYTLNVPSNTTNNIQEMHIAIGHLLCDIIEKNINV